MGKSNTWAAQESAGLHTLLDTRQETRWASILLSRQARTATSPSAAPNSELTSDV